MKELAFSITTKLGTYGPGTPVIVIRRHRYRHTVCLDPDGEHPNNRCHKATVDCGWLRNSEAEEWAA